MPPIVDGRRRGGLPLRPHRTAFVHAIAPTWCNRTHRDRATAGGHGGVIGAALKVGSAHPIRTILGIHLA
jgi:hypothetical protein